MIMRFTASNIVAMILFIPLLIALGLILAFIVPLLAVIAAAAGIFFLSIYTFAKIGLVKKQRVEIGRGDEEHFAKLHKKETQILQSKIR